MLVTELLRRNAERYPDQEALIAVDAKGLVPSDDASYSAHRRSYTWAEFDRIADQVANYYRSIGIGPGNRIAIMLMNCLEWLPVYFGILRSGAVAVPLNFRYHADDVVRSCRFAEVDAMVLGDHCREIVDACVPSLPAVRSYVYLGSREACPGYAVSWEDSYAKAGTEASGVSILPSDLAAIYYSSGTTGRPKAVMYAHGTLAAAWELERSNHHQVHEDCFVLIPPLYHVGGKLHWMGGLPVGAPCVLLLGFDVDAFFEVMSRERVTIAFLLLPWAQDILARMEAGMLDPARYDLSRWRMFHMGGQPIPPAVIRRMQAFFPRIECQVSYGLTESGGPGCLNLPGNRMDKLGSVGLPADKWSVRIVDRNGAPVPLGQPGELLLKGPGVMPGYYKDPELTRKTIVDGWLHTGDLARMDQEGFVYTVGRIKDVIISGGENVYPVPIEEFLRSHPAVRDAAVFGIREDRLGEIVAAQVELAEGAECTEEELAGFVRKLPRFQRPRRIFIGKVPRNPTGKIDKKALRSKYSPPPPIPPTGRS